MENSLMNKVTISSKMGKIYCALVGVFAFLYIISNILECRAFVIDLPFTYLYITGGIFAYPILFLLTDIIGEIYGEKASRLPVFVGLAALVVEIVMTQLMIHLPGQEWVCMEGAYESVFGTNFRFAMASICAFMASQLIDVRVFHAIKNWTERKFGDSKKFRFLYNNSATMLCQIIDSFIYAIIAIGFCQDAIHLAITGIGVKWVMAWLDTIPFYLITNHLYKIRDKEYPELAK